MAPRPIILPVALDEIVTFKDKVTLPAMVAGPGTTSTQTSTLPSSSSTVISDATNLTESGKIKCVKNSLN